MRQVYEMQMNDLVFEMVTPGNNLQDNLRLGLAKKKVQNISRDDLLDEKVTIWDILRDNLLLGKNSRISQGRAFGPKGHPFALAKFQSKSTTQIVSKSKIGRLSFEILNIPNPTFEKPIAPQNRKIPLPDSSR